MSAGGYCPQCGRVLKAGVRVSADARIRVRVCMDSRTGAGCGYETPPLYWRAGRKWPGTDENDDDMHELPVLSAAAVQGAIRRVG